jgi:hypothetical protein
VISSFLNLRVSDIRRCYERWSSRGAKFITEPKTHATEYRCYMRDPDGYLIEVGQTTMTAGPLDLYRVTAVPSAHAVHAPTIWIISVRG